MALWLLIGLATASRCPSYTCKALANNTCVEFVSGQAFNLNTEGCQSGYCSAVTVDAWTQATGSLSANLPCSGTAPSLPSAISSCPTKLLKKDFLSGASVLTCTSSADCVLEDYSQQPCKCGFREDGLGVCEPHTSNSDVFGDFWSECGKENSISDETIGQYWALYMNIWVYIQGAVSCSNMLAEMQKLAQLGVNHAAFISLLWLNAI